MLPVGPCGGTNLSPVCTQAHRRRNGSEAAIVKFGLGRGAIGLVLMLLGLLSPVTRPIFAQTVSAVPTLDLNRYMGVWFVIAQYPVKAERKCARDTMVLYALGDKPNSFQRGTSCDLNNGSSDSWNVSGRLGKTQNGELKLTHLVLFSSKYWVLATGTGYEWALVGSPNHKSLWVLSRKKTLDAERLGSIEAKASSEGFDTTRLHTIAQRP